MASSHVLSPWKWPQYYGQEWLREVKEEHVRYSLEVYGHRANDVEGKDDVGTVNEGKLKGSYGPIAKFALNPYPIHHPNGLDVAVIHLKGEDDGEFIAYCLYVLLRYCNYSTLLDFYLHCLIFNST